jgi:hypothetical protein
MRAREFTINVPITIKINGDDDPEVNVPDQEPDEPKLQNNPVMVSPLQQDLELRKAEQGKSSPVIDKIMQNDNIGAETRDSDTSLLNAIKKLIAR